MSTIINRLSNSQLISRSVSELMKSSQLSISKRRVSFSSLLKHHPIVNSLKVSDAMPGVNVLNCNFFWRSVYICEEDLVPLIKAKAGCGHFQINLKDKLDAARRVLASNNTHIELEGESEEGSAIEIPEVEKMVVEDTTTDSASESSHGKGDGIITSAKFTAYINESQNTKRLLHSDHIEPSVRRGIISSACDFLFKECGEYASVSDRNEMVKVVVDVFRGLEMQEQFVTKWLHMKIKNNRRKAKLADEAIDCTSKKRKTETTEKEDRSHLDFLKSCKEAVDIPKIKTALKATINIRLEQCNKEDFCVFDTYNFFTKSPDLVGFFRNLMIFL